MREMMWFGALSALLVGCGGEEQAPVDSGDTTAAGTFDDAELAAALWEELGGYESWGQREGWTTEPVESGDHMGALVVAYYNDPLLEWAGTGEAPEGAVAVKEGWVHAGATGGACNPCGTSCGPACGTGCGTACGTHAGCGTACGTSCGTSCGTAGTGDGELVLESLTVMKKIAGYAPDGGDWFWAMYGADGTVMEAGQVAMCVGCHAAAPADYVFGAPPQ